MKKKKFVIVILIIIGIFYLFTKDDAPFETPKGKQFTFGKGHDEDAFFMRAQNGKYYAAWVSNERGSFDVWMKESPDGKNWSALPRLALGDKQYNDFMQSIIQTRDGTFHLTGWRKKQELGSSGHDIWDSTSPDGITWSEPKLIEGNDSFDWAGFMREDLLGNLWVVWSSDREGKNMNIYSMMSRDNGATWSKPKQLTFSEKEDDLPFFLITKNGTFVITWLQYKKPFFSLFPYFSDTTEIVMLTSRDGEKWNGPIQITNDTEEAYIDTIPSVYEKADGNAYIAWITARGGLGAVEVPVSDPRPENVRRLPQYTGYSIRNLPLHTGENLRAWVTENKTDGKKNKDIFYEIAGD